MNNELQIFQNEQFGAVRTLAENGTMLFCGSDVARALGYAKPQNAIAAHCKGALKRSTLTAGGAQEMSFIPEADVYRLVMRSNLPEAERFEAWVCEDILPTVRQTGAYMTPETIEQVLLNPDTIINLATQIKELQSKVAADAPKVLFASAVEASHTSILIGDLAKLICQNGVKIGQQRMFQWLRDNGYLMKNKNLPTQYSMERGLMEIREGTVYHPGGNTLVTQTTVVTGKGQTYFINKFLANAV